MWELWSGTEGLQRQEEELDLIAVSFSTSPYSCHSGSNSIPPGQAIVHCSRGGSCPVGGRQQRPRESVLQTQDPCWGLSAAAG